MYEIHAYTVAAPNFEVRLSTNRSNLKECKALSSCSAVQLKNVRRGPFCSLKCSYTWLSFISLSLLPSSKCPPWNLKLPKNRIITGVSLSCSAFGIFFFVLNNDTMTKTKSILNRKIEIESVNANANANDWWNKINESDEWQSGIFYALCAAYVLVSLVALVLSISLYCYFFISTFNVIW